MSFYRSMTWPSSPAFFSKIFRSSPGTSSHSDSTPQKPKRWAFPAIPLPSIQSLRFFLPSQKKDDNPKSSHSNLDIEHFQICINLVHHIIDICTSGFLWLFSPVFRVTLDVFGLQGALKLWIHGLAIFLATTYGMYLLLWLAQEYIFQLASFYGLLQTLVLCVSLKAEKEEKEEERRQEDASAMEKEDEVEGEMEQGEDRWGGGSENEENSLDEWESDGEEEVGNA